MKQSLLILPLLIASVPAAMQAQNALSPSAIAVRARPAVLTITALDSRGSARAAGTGFFIDSVGTIVTNYHVIEGAADLVVKTSDGSTYRDVDLITYNQTVDLAILRVHAQQTPHLPIATRTSVTVGDAIFTMGNPLGLEASFTAGIVSALREFDGVDWLQISAPISPGSSGGPILDDRGRVVGVATWTMKGGQSLNMAIRSSYVLELQRVVRTPVSFRDAAVPSANKVMGYGEARWGSSVEDVRRIRGTPEVIDRTGEYRMFKYSGQAFGLSATNTYFIDDSGGLTMGADYIYIPAAGCAAQFERIRDEIGFDLGGVAAKENLERPPTGNLCDQIQHGAARWTAEWLVDGGAVSMVLAGYGSQLLIVIAYTRRR